MKGKEKIQETLQSRNEKYRQINKQNKEVCVWNVDGLKSGY